MSLPAPPEMPVETTEDRLLGGRLVLSQPREGYRAGMDAALLAAACDAGAGERVLEAGCGAGAALLAAAARRPGAQFLGLERDAAAADLGRRNAAANRLSERVEVRAFNIAGGFAALGEARFDAVMANPPFFDDPGALRAPAPAKRGAWMAEGGLAAWTGFLLAAVQDRGTVTLIHRADRLADILALLSAKAGSFQIRPIHPFAEAPAKRVLVRAVRGGKGPLQLLPPLVLHPQDGAKHTAQAEAILRGDADLPWR
ncbi:methyltransferase [Phenylobacterium terrae]|uniref:Methyltransferase n=1 Tax=Phenylobacterium terrae TaxID=2665495 RepID=A0ABW4N3H3_9CAUL